ncbi:lipopolysaccharide kinase InaA family protein [Nitratireductor kimnyeongensis]|uniref:Lipopolysaccharide kinase InaA family protein n=1 Tax=Nitratireductor kimnyeongensis TaxID=430679 RepID=A0ABW0TD46_9HYPH|nr:lipopolysaccharide kinase InaA family protein [Nitratireductor kimnyeongensis]
MHDKTKSEKDLLSPEATAALLRLLITGERQRVSSTVLDGHTVWIKRYDVERQPAAKWLHTALTPLMPAAFLRASPGTNTATAIEREVRKLDAFREAGLPTAKLLFRNDRVLVLSNVAPIAQSELDMLARHGEHDAHEGLLVQAADALRKAHSLGLCHGRPHPRDMFITNDGRWGFVDFEEEPEAAMPLAIAQARDVWLLFLQICMQSKLADTPQKAFDAYFVEPPRHVADELRRIIRFFTPLIPLLGAIEHWGLGSDGKRVLKATRFLKTALGENTATPATQSQNDIKPKRGYEA